MPNAKDKAARQLRVNTEMDVVSVISIESQADAAGRKTMQPEGSFRTLLAMNGRVIDLRQIRGDLLGDPSRATASSISINCLRSPDSMWLGTNCNPIGSCGSIPALRALAGRIQGISAWRRLGHTAAGTTDARCHLERVGRDWRTIQIGGAEIHAFLVLKRNDSPMPPPPWFT